MFPPFLVSAEAKKVNLKTFFIKKRERKTKRTFLASEKSLNERDGEKKLPTKSSASGGRTWF